MSKNGATITVRGRVQGVGFRYYCFQTANDLGLKGWVRNESDGSVSICVTGERSEVEQLIKHLKAGPGSPIVSDVDIDWLETAEQCSSFEIKM